MEIKNDKKTVITGKRICLIAGIVSAICGLYWIARVLFYDDTCLPAILSSVTIALFLTLYAGRR